MTCNKFVTEKQFFIYRESCSEAYHFASNLASDEMAAPTYHVARWWCRL